jgi:high-affinity iron transporter
MSGYPRRALHLMTAIFALAALASPAFAAMPDAESASAFGQSLIILLREGAEAILIFAALWAVLRRMDAPARSFSALVRGALAGATASILAAWALAEGLASAGAAAPVIEGASLLLAALVLLFVSSWLLGKREAQNWRDHIKKKTRMAAAGGGVTALFATAFLAIFREGAETVLFYEALISSQGGQTLALLAGAAAAAFILAAAFWLVRAAGLRLPLRGFFTATAWLLLALAVIYAGQGVHEWQEAGLISETELSALPHVKALGLFPTLETFAAQILTLLAALALNARLPRHQNQPAE